MEYRSAKETALDWGLSLRYVQRRCEEGRIPGAEKLGGVWMIPAGAQRPPDGRTQAGKSARSLPVWADPDPLPDIEVLPLMNSSFSPGGGEEAVRSRMGGEGAIARAELAYFVGRPEEAADLTEPWLESGDLSLRLSACLVYGYANITLSRQEGTRRALAETEAAYRSLGENAPKRLWALAVFTCATMATLLRIPKFQGLPEMQQCIHLLPTGLRLFAIYVQGRQAYQNELYGVSVGMAETALVLEGEIYPIPTIYLHLLCAMGYMHSHYLHLAREHLRLAWEMAEKDGLLAPFAELHGQLGGVVESELKKTDPEGFRRVIRMANNFSQGWRKIHNALTGEAVPTNLTASEFTVASLASRGWSNREIADHLGISENTVKSNVSAVIRKLGISHRKDLKNIMPR